MRISDWSSDVCSSDLGDERVEASGGVLAVRAIEEGLEGLAAVAELALELVHERVVAGSFVAAQCRDHEFRLEHSRLPRGPVRDRRPLGRSEERRVGKEWVSTFRFGGAAFSYKKKH